MTSQEILLGELDMYKESLEQWLKKLNQENEDLCQKFLLTGQMNKEELTERYCKMMKSKLCLKEHQFRQSLQKHVSGLSQIMNKLMKLIDVTNSLEDKPEEPGQANKSIQEEPVAKSKCKKRKLKIPARDLVGVNEDTQHAVLF